MTAADIRPALERLVDVVALSQAKSVAGVQGDVWDQAIIQVYDEEWAGALGEKIATRAKFSVLFGAGTLSAAVDAASTVTGEAIAVEVKAAAAALAGMASMLAEQTGATTSDVLRGLLVGAPGDDQHG